MILKYIWVLKCPPMIHGGTIEKVVSCSTLVANPGNQRCTTIISFNSTTKVTKLQISLINPTSRSVLVHTLANLLHSSHICNRGSPGSRPKFGETPKLELELLLFSTSSGALASLGGETWLPRMVLYPTKHTQNASHNAEIYIYMCVCIYLKVVLQVERETQKQCSQLPQSKSYCTALSKLSAGIKFLFYMWQGPCSVCKISTSK